MRHAIRPLLQPFRLISDRFPGSLGLGGLRLKFRQLIRSDARAIVAHQRHQPLGNVVSQPAATHQTLHTRVHFGAGENACQGVVIGLRNRIELVIVAAGTTDRQSQQGPRDHIDLLVDVVHLKADREPLIDVLHAERKKTGRDPLAVGSVVVRRGQQVARDLFADELGERHIAMDGVDHVIAVPPRMRIGNVAARPGGLAVAGDVKPMTRPVFAKRGRLEQSIHNRLERFGAIVRQKGPQLVHRRRQSGKVERHAPQQRSLVRVGDRRQPFGLKPRKHKVIDRAARPSLALDRWRRRSADRLPSPMRLSQFVIVRGLTLRLDLQSGPRRPVFNPPREHRDLLIGKRLALGGHSFLRIFGNPLQEQTLLRFAGNHARTAVSALQESIAVVDSEPARRLRIRRVAGDTVPLEDRPHMPLEVFHLRRRFGTPDGRGHSGQTQPTRGQRTGRNPPDRKPPRRKPPRRKPPRRKPARRKPARRERYCDG